MNYIEEYIERHGCENCSRTSMRCKHMKTYGYLMVVTAHYIDDSSLGLETREYENISEVTSELAACKLEYESVLSKDTFKDESIIIDIRVFELNTLIPKLVSSFSLESGAWGGWSFI